MGRLHLRQWDREDGRLGRFHPQPAAYPHQWSTLVCHGGKLFISCTAVGGSRVMFWPFTPTCSWKCWKRSMVKLRGLINPRDSLKWINSIRAIIKEVVAHCQTNSNRLEKKQNAPATNDSWELAGNPHLTVIIRCLSRRKEAVRIWLPSQHDLWPGSHRPEENRIILCIYHSKEFSGYVTSSCHFGNCYMLGPEEKKKNLSMTLCLFEIISELHCF